MRTQMAYCSACDRQVEVVVPEDLPEGSLPSAHDPASCICLEFGESCTGSLCPLFEVPTVQMEENYRRIVKEIREGRDGSGKGGNGKRGNGKGGDGKGGVDEGPETDGGPQGPDEV